MQPLRSIEIIVQVDVEFNLKMYQDKFLHILTVEVGLERTVLPNNYSDFQSVKDYCEIKPRLQ